MATAACGAKALSLLQRTLWRSPLRGCPVPTAVRPCGHWPCSAGGERRSRAPTIPCLSVPCLCPQDTLSSGLRTCYKYLDQTSRSFSAVIQALDEELR